MLLSLTTKREFIPVRKILLKKQTNPYTYKKPHNLQPKSKGKLEKKILKVRKIYQEVALGFTYLLLPHCLDQSTCLIAPSETWKLGLFKKGKRLKKRSQTSQRSKILFKGYKSDLLYLFSKENAFEKSLQVLKNLSSSQYR